MLGAGELFALLRAVGLFLLVCAGIWFANDLWDGATGLIKAPVQTQLDVSRSNNAGFKASTEEANKGVDATKAEADRRQAKSQEALKGAGKPEFRRADDIKNAPAVGETDYERAMKRVDRELGLQ